VQEFGEKARYFNTFGGNPVAAAAGMAVLDVIEDEGLQENSRKIGALMKEGLQGIASTRSNIGDVRGAGLFLAVECVTDTDSNAPDAALARHVVNHLRQNGVLISATGPGANILKIRPPLIFNQREAEQFVDAMEAAFDAA
jgi:4-aminobutyrate aminotransferase-like enzyme